eukprot:120182-Pleurochrysis_carterae.AAC.1
MRRRPARDYSAQSPSSHHQLARRSPRNGGRDSHTAAKSSKRSLGNNNRASVTHHNKNDLAFFSTTASIPTAPSSGRQAGRYCRAQGHHCRM